MRTHVHTAARALVLLSVFLCVPLHAQPSDTERRLDAIFAHFTTRTPGCAVGVERRGEPTVTKGYGMANLEYGVPLKATSVLESGSVAKQFTSAALALLQLEGRLTLDDDIRKHLPEAPDFGTPITIRMLLTHTSGLRDQWGLLSLTGNPPTRQVHTIPLILHLVSRQRDLNFAPGAEYLYSNTGYALAGVIVQRVSGQALAAFSRERFFKPLGMANTQWRDDFQRIVPERATAYERADSGYATLMPFTNVYGNGGLLTTVGDMLRWNAALTNGTIPGGKALVELLETRGTLTGGVRIPYALGLVHGTRNGHREVSHSGSTAGYQTLLTRFPEAGLSVAVFCNVTTANPGGLATRVIDTLLPTAAAAARLAAPSSDTLAAGVAMAGRYRDPAREEIADILATPNGLVLRSAFGGGRLDVAGAGRVRTADGTELTLTGTRPNRTFTAVAVDDVQRRYIEVPPIGAASPQLAELAGTYRSPELDVTYSVVVHNGALRVTYAPYVDVLLTPLDRDLFQGDGRLVRFTRDAGGRVNGLRVSAGRVRHVRFDRSQ